MGRIFISWSDIIPLVEEMVVLGKVTCIFCLIHSYKSGSGRSSLIIADKLSETADKRQIIADKPTKIADKSLKTADKPLKIADKL